MKLTMDEQLEYLRWLKAKGCSFLIFACDGPREAEPEEVLKYVDDPGDWLSKYGGEVPR